MSDDTTTSTDESTNPIDLIKQHYESPKDFKKDLQKNANDYHQVIWSEAFGAGKNEASSSLEPKLNDYKSKYESLQEEYKNNNSDEVIQNKQQKIQELEQKVQDLQSSKKDYGRNYQKKLFLEQVKSKAANRLDSSWVNGVLHDPQYQDRYEVVEEEGGEFNVRFIDEDGAPVKGADPADKMVDLLYNSASDPIRIGSTKSTGIGDTSSTTGGKSVYPWSEVQNNADLMIKYQNDKIEVDPDN